VRLVDLRWALLRPARDRIVRGISSRYRAVVDLGVRSLVHPVAIVGYAMIVGLLLRAFRIGTNPPGLNQDEAVAGYDAWSVWHTLRDHHGHPLPVTGFLSFGDWSSPFLYFLLVPIVGIFGLDVTTLRAGSILLGMVAILATYLLAVELTGRRATGAAAACFVALSPWAVHLSRFAIPPATVPALLPLGIWLTLRAIRLKTTGSVLLAGIALGSCVAGYQTMKLYVPLVGLLIAVLFFRAWVLIPLRSLLGGAAALLAVAGPNLLFSLRDPDGANRQRFISVFNRDDLSPGFFFEQFWSYINPHYLFTNRNENDAADAASRFTTELSWTIPFLVIGLIALVIRAVRPDLALIHRRPALLLGGLIVLAPVPGMFTTIQNGSREVELTVLFAIVAGIGLVTLGDLIQQTLRRIATPGIRMATVVLVAVVALAPLGVQARDRYREYFQEYPRDGSVQRYFHTGLIEAAQYAYSVQDDYDTIWFVDTNQGYMIFLLANQIDPSYVHDELDQDHDREDFGSYLVDGIGEFRFNGVYVGLDENIGVLNQRVVFESFPYESGRGYIATAGNTPDGQSILVVSSQVR
jgi:4-amino-4-deoxy-L-arabinose transferase-like glycosyltransferase